MGRDRANRLRGLFLGIALSGSVMMLLAAAAGLGATLPADWPHWLGPNSSGISTETGWQTDWAAHPPKVLWKKSVGEGFAIVSVVGDRVYTTGNADGKDTVFCLKAGTGEEIWKFSYPCEAGQHPGTRCTPTIDGNLLFTFSREGDLFCLDAATGAKKWQVNLVRLHGAAKPMWGFGTHPVILGDQVIMTVGPVLCFNKNSGDLVWKSGSDKGGYSSATVFECKNKTLLATLVNDGLLIVDAADGKEVARFPWPTSRPVHIVTPIVEGNRIFFASGYGMGGALVELGDDGLKEIWRTKDMKNQAANSILYEGFLYGFDGDVDSGVLTCIDFKTGQKKWAKDDLKAGSLMIADGKIVAMSSKGDLVLAEASPQAYKELGRVPVLGGASKCWTMPILCGGRIYCRNQAGDLVCLSVQGP
jgi:outer membrane protein assembly factor BamB